ncbi:5'-methylthioadenosine/S-adenosylhomocysteine nucleosidase family protein [Aspergillus undulatus]|uniref:5'-methylthioadenosine/S-adenosylhomocysteine nucleosidase family protein n=1 Tax=Aspergillus undulatus TaxID=1810928 RepID=UPI003CCCFBC5
MFHPPPYTDLDLTTTPPTNSPLKLSDFTVGWICALEKEYIAALEVLTEEYGPSTRIASFLRTKGDRNIYTLGRIGPHNVVILCPEARTYGLVQASGVAADMKRSFRSIRFILMVGVAGAAPSTKQDVRLGDVVIGTRVLPYGFGKETVDGFQGIGETLDAPHMLRSCATQLKVAVARGLSLQREVEEMSRRSLVQDGRFERPDMGTDRLYGVDYTHCEGCDCLSAGGKSIQRIPRHEGRLIEVHLGTVASADRVMKNAKMRDRLASAHDVLCFEMESAGLMGKYNCLPIRGVCDYSDSHKNDHWHDYAAAAAAVCARELLRLIEPKQTPYRGVPMFQDGMDQFMGGSFAEIERAMEGSVRFIEQLDTLHRRPATTRDGPARQPQGPEGCPIQ